MQDLVRTTQEQRDRLLLANQQLQSDLHRHQQDTATIQEQAALLNIATDAIIVRDLDWNIRFWNKGAEQLYGWSAQEACDQNAYQLLNRMGSVELEEAGQQVLAMGTWSGELTKTTKAGQEKTVSSRWALVRGEDGTPQAILSVDTDITERKQLQEQLLRTQRLESLGTLASGIAHDLNNIFAPILIASQLLPLKLKNLNEQEHRLVDTLNASARRGSSLVQQILSFARGLAGERTPVQLRHVLDEVRQICISTFPKSIEVDLRIQDRQLWMVNADANQLHQVLMNLCVNGRDAMPKGGHLVLGAANIILSAESLKNQPEAQPGSYVQVTVKDTGTGIPPEVQAHIFDPFFTTKEVGKGTGLGLSTTLGIIKSHGGFIEVESEMGQGTEFRLYLPAELETTGVEAHEPGPLLQGQNELILLVDDEPQILATLCMSLETYNYRVLTAVSGFDAIARYTEHQQDIALVLTDLLMPDMNGEDLMRVLKILNPEIRVIAASGSQTALREDKGMVTVLVKPYNLEDVLAAIATTLHPR